MGIADSTTVASCGHHTGFVGIRPNRTSAGTSRNRTKNEGPRPHATPDRRPQCAPGLLGGTSVLQQRSLPSRPTDISHAGTTRSRCPVTHARACTSGECRARRTDRRGRRRKGFARRRPRVSGARCSLDRTATGRPSAPLSAERVAHTARGLVVGQEYSSTGATIRRCSRGVDQSRITGLMVLPWCMSSVAALISSSL